MTFDYANIRDNVVKVQIARFGQSATLKQPGATTGDDWDPTPGTPIPYTVKVVKSRFTQADRAGSLIREDDLVFLMSMENDPEPDLEGTLTVNSVVYQIFKLEPVSPGDTILAWRVFCRK